jgi:hypothetical protein
LGIAFRVRRMTLTRKSPNNLAAAAQTSPIAWLPARSKSWFSTSIPNIMLFGIDDDMGRRSAYRRPVGV